MRKSKEKGPSIWLNYCRITTSTASSALTVAWCSARAPRVASPGQEQEAESFATSKFIRVFKKFLWDCQMKIALGVDKNVTLFCRPWSIICCFPDVIGEDKAKASQKVTDFDHVTFYKTSERYLQWTSSSSPVLITAGYHLMMNDVRIFSKKLWCYF